MFSWMIFGMITPQVFWDWSPEYSKLSLFDSVADQIESHIHFFWFLLKNSFIPRPTAVEFSTWIAVGPCFKTNSISVVRMGISVCALMRMVPYPASAVDAMMLRIIFQTTSMIPLPVGMKYYGFCGLGGPSLRKWTPLARLLYRETEMYEASEWIANLIPLVRYWTYAFGLEAK